MHTRAKPQEIILVDQLLYDKWGLNWETLAHIKASKSSYIDLRDDDVDE